MFILQWQLSLATLVVFPICLIPVVIYGRKLRKTHSGIHQKFAGAANVLHESFTGIRVIKAYNLETHGRGPVPRRRQGNHQLLHALGPRQ